MPIFEYRCSNCNSLFEKLVLQSGIAVSCPKCGSSEIAKQFSAFAVRSGGKRSGGDFSSAGSSGCASCPGGNCSTCR